jgi:hypothetical protein
MSERKQLSRTDLPTNPATQGGGTAKLIVQHHGRVY